MKLKRTAVSICVLAVVGGFAINYYLTKLYKINPSIYSLIDYQLFDFTASKPWNYI